jgi:hypothetical protein
MGARKKTVGYYPPKPLVMIPKRLTDPHKNKATDRQKMTHWTSHQKHRHLQWAVILSKMLAEVGNLRRNRVPCFAVLFHFLGVFCPPRGRSIKLAATMTV